MQLTIRKANPTDKQPNGGVVIEVRMSIEDAKAFAHRSPQLETAIEDSMTEHMRHRSTIGRTVHTGGHA